MGDMIRRPATTSRAVVFLPNRVASAKQVVRLPKTLVSVWPPEKLLTALSTLILRRRWKKHGMLRIAWRRDKHVWQADRYAVGLAKTIHGLTHTGPKLASATGASITRQSDGYTDLAYCETGNQVHNDPVRQHEPGHIVGQGWLRPSRFDLPSRVSLHVKVKIRGDIAMR